MVAVVAVYTVALSELPKVGSGFLVPAARQAVVLEGELVLLREQVGDVWRFMLGVIQLDGQGRKVLLPLSDLEMVAP